MSSKITCQSAWVDIVETKDLKLIACAVGAVLDADVRMDHDDTDDTDIKSKDDRDDHEAYYLVSNDFNSPSSYYYNRRLMISNVSFDDIIERNYPNKKRQNMCACETPILWAANNGLDSILHVMLNKAATLNENHYSNKYSQNTLNVNYKDKLGNTVWEYVTGLSFTQLLQSKNNEDIEYRYQNVNISAMKILINRLGVNVNRLDSCGKNALYRIRRLNGTLLNIKSQAIALLHKNMNNF